VHKFSCSLTKTVEDDNP